MVKKKVAWSSKERISRLEKHLHQSLQLQDLKI
ncbi:MAG: hypothetical protein ACI9S8_000733 [Chlamydiales bacterium]|jgi:hypothetical protein